MTGYLEARVAERRQRLDALLRQRTDIDREVIVAEAELRAYLDALQNSSKGSEHAGLNGAAQKSVVNEPEVAAADKPRLPKSEQYAASRMSPSWRAIFSEMEKRYPEPLSIEEMDKAARDADAPMTSQSLRGGASMYAKRGWLRRVRIGTYKPTEDGAAAAGITLRDPSSAAPTNIGEGRSSLF